MSRTTQERTRLGRYRRRVLEDAVRRHPSAEMHTGTEWIGRTLRYGGVLLLAMYLLFAHSCHGGDEDTELLARPAETVAWQE